MKIKKYIILAINIAILCSLGIPLSIAKAPFGKCTSSIIKPTKTMAKKSSRYALLDMDADEEELSPTIFEENLIDVIRRSFSSTFYDFGHSSPKFTTNKVDIDKFESWINLLSCVYEWLENIKKYANFKNDIVKIYSLSNFIYHHALELYTKKLTAAQRAVIKKEIAEKLKVIVQINLNAVAAIEKSSEPKDWQKQVPTTSQLSHAIEHYTGSFNAYLSLKKENKYATESDYFKKILDNVAHPRHVENDVNTLEEVIYRLKDSFQWNIVQKIALTKFCKSYLQAILNRYGNGLYFISKAFKNSLQRSRELEPKIVFELSVLMFIGINKLLNEL